MNPMFLILIKLSYKFWLVQIEKGLIKYTNR